MNLELRQRIFSFGLLALLLAGCLWVLRPFVEAAAWAAILGWVTWPFYRRIRPAFGNREGLAAVVMTFLLILIAATPALLLTLALSGEIRRVIPDLVVVISHGPPAVPEGLKDVPILGEMIQKGIDSLWLVLGDMQGRLGQGANAIALSAMKAAGNVGRVFATVGMTILIVYFIFRYGEAILSDVRAVADRIAGQEAVRFIDPVGRTVRAVVYGILLTAIVQGALAGLGYWVAGMRGPILLGAVTAFLALFPFGAPLVWGPAALWLWGSGRAVAGIGLAIWGALIVGSADSVIRPWVISGTTKVPFLFVFFGVIGGVLAFGLLGLFIGPVLLSVLLTLWRESAAALGGDDAGEIR